MKTKLVYTSNLGQFRYRFIRYIRFKPLQSMASRSCTRDDLTIQFDLMYRGEGRLAFSLFMVGFQDVGLSQQQEVLASFP